MTQYNSLNVRLSNSQLNKLKSSIKNETDVVLRISSNMVGDSNDNINFPNELLLTMNYCYLLDKLQIFVKLLLIIHQLTLNCQKLNYQK